MNIDEACKAVTEKALNVILKSIGINAEDMNDDELHRVMAEKGVNVFEQNWGVEASELNGLYVYQSDRPVGFVCVPMVSTDGKVIAKTVLFNQGNIEQTIGD